MPKKYWAKVPGPIERDLHRTLRAGIELEDGLAKVDSFNASSRSTRSRRSTIEIVLHEGRKHIVRRLLEETGHPRDRPGPHRVRAVKLGRLKPGDPRAQPARSGQLYASVKL